MNDTKIDEKSKRHLYVFEPSSDEELSDGDQYYDESALLPIENDFALLKGRTCEMELSLKLKQLERLFDSNNRYYYALQKVEHAIRYLQGYLSDYTVTVRRELKPNRIRVIIDIEPFDELNTVDRVREKMKSEIKRIFPELDESKVEEIANRLTKSLCGGGSDG